MVKKNTAQKKDSENDGDDPVPAVAETKSKQYMIYVEIDDEITTVFDQIKKLPVRLDVVLVIPKRAVLLQSVINLRILKKKVAETRKGRNVMIITNDKSGQILAGQAGIPVLDKIPSSKQAEDTKSGGSFSHRPLLDATANLGGSHQRPVRLPEKKVPLSSLLQKGQTSLFKNFVKKITTWRRARQKKHQKLPEVVIVAPNKQALFIFMLVTVLIFMIVAYVALPGATLYLTPESGRIEQSINVTLAEFQRNQAELGNHPPRIMASYEITPPEIRHTINYFATGKEFRGENARGILTVINESLRVRELVAQTRFQTDDGMIFRITRAVSVPAGTVGKPATVSVEAVADPFDVSGQIVGERGNIPPTRFVIPGLKNEENRRTLYGQNYQAMSGGITRVVKTVTKDDVDSAKKKAAAEAVDAARRELKNYLTAQNIERKTNLKLLTHDSLIKISEPQITIEQNLIGATRDSFSVTAAVTVRGFAYNPDELGKILERELNLRKSPDKRIVQVDQESITYKVIEFNESTGRVKITATIRGVEQYEVRPEKESGARLIKKIKDHIVGKSLNEASLFVQNLPEIDHVEIKSWPFWAPNIPSVPDNIKIVIQEG